MRATVLGYIAGEVRESRSQKGSTSYNHPVFVPGTRDARAETFEAYSQAKHPAWGDDAYDGELLVVEVDIQMRSFDGRSFQSITLLSVAPAAPNGSKPTAPKT